MTESPARIEVVGVPLSMTSYDDTIRRMAEPPTDRALTVAVCNVHSVMSARRNEAIFEAIAGADLATPDGQPLVWAIRSLGHPSQERVYGPELMRRALIDTALRHYLYGATDETLGLLEIAVNRLNSGVRLAGRHAPPFAQLSDAELDADAARIRESGADIVWVGLGMPKQELWMHRMRDRLPGMSVVGVGAAFDILAGRVRQAPPVIQRLGLEWLFRLVQEPRRLWRRYVYNNPAYLASVFRQIANHRLRQASFFDNR